MSVVKNKRNTMVVKIGSARIDENGKAKGGKAVVTYWLGNGVKIGQMDVARG